MKAPVIVWVPVSMRVRAMEAAQRARASGFSHFSDALVRLSAQAPAPDPMFDHQAEPVSTEPLPSHEISN